jgi:hypothetical protein
MVTETVNIKDLKGRCLCDNGHEFNAEQVELTPFGTGFSAPSAPIRFVNKDGTLMCGEPKADDRVMACPVCHRVHLFGFNQRNIFAEPPRRSTMVSRVGQLREKLDRSGIAGNPIITDEELKELLAKLKEFQDAAIDWQDKPLVDCLSRHIESVNNVISNRHP